MDEGLRDKVKERYAGALLGEAADRLLSSDAEKRGAAGGRCC